MTVDQTTRSAPRNPERVSWIIDADRRLVIIDVEADFTDYDLIKVFPKLWRENPDVIWYNAIVSHKGEDSTGNWSWSGFLTLAEDWKSYSQGRNPEKRVAVVTTNYWIAKLAASAMGLIFSGNVIKCFKNEQEATEWALAGPRPEIE